MRIYWGDLHNHCAVSYGKGTPERALDNARQHLDFCSVTGHAFWPDLPMDLETQNAIIGMHLGGFAKLRYYWKDLLHQLKAAEAKGNFVTFPSYEWHSMKYGDYNCYFHSHETDLIDGPSPAALEKALHKTGGDFMMLPHHCAYVRGFRGTNWQFFDARRSPLVEIFSNHGSGESDDAPYDYHHSMGPRVGESMVRSGLAAGHRFGFYAGTDSHDGYPGHYGHGITGVLSNRLDHTSIWQALKERRTIATTGARISAEAVLGDAAIGQVAPHGGSVPLQLKVEGTAPIERVDLVEGTRSGNIRVRRIAGTTLEPKFTPGRHKIKIECGWGRGEEISNWKINARIHNGKLSDVQPCYRYSQYRQGETGSTEKIIDQTSESVDWVCRAAANPAGIIGGTHFKAGGTQAIILDVDAGKGAELNVTFDNSDIRASLSDLAVQSVGKQRAGFGSPAVKIHRAIPEREFRFIFEDTNYRPFSDEGGFLYFRVLQADGHVAWLSPIWYEGV